jgi:hypothetical protein
MSGFVDVGLKKRVEKVNFSHVGHEYSKRGCVVARVFVAADEMEINCFVLEVRNYNCWNHTVLRFPTFLASG